jgi:hypothetical protein
MVFIGNLTIAPSSELRPAPLFAPTRKAAQRFLEFFTAQINNAHTRRAYMNATRRFAEWCASKEIHELAVGMEVIGERSALIEAATVEPRGRKGLISVIIITTP